MGVAEDGVHHSKGAEKEKQTTCQSVVSPRESSENEKMGGIPRGKARHKSCRKGLAFSSGNPPRGGPAMGLRARPNLCLPEATVRDHIPRMGA